MTRRRGRVLLGIVVACGLVAAAPAHAGLTYRGCFKDVGGASPCPMSAPGLQESDSVLVAPGDGQVYTTSAFDSAVGTFTRDTGTGALTFSACWSRYAVGDAGCSGLSDLIGNVVASAISPDGRDLYAAADNGLTHFTRNTTTGAITPVDCWTDTTVSGGSCTQHAEGLLGGLGVVVSPDGANVYVTAFRVSTLVVFNRNASTGVLTYGGCIRTSGLGPTPACAQIVPGMLQPRGLAITPDGGGLYVAAADSGSISEFRRASDAGHALTSLGCISESDPACSTHANALSRATDVAITSDSQTVLVSAGNGVSVFSRDPATSALHAAGCVAGTGFAGSSTTCGPTPAQSGEGQIALSPDGRSVYTGGLGPGATSGALSIYARDPTTGILTYVSCIRDTAAPSLSCGASVDGLRTEAQMAVTGDGSTLYVAARAFANENRAMLAWFSRTPDKVAPPDPPKLVGTKIALPPGALTASLPIDCNPGVTQYCDGSILLAAGGSARTAARSGPKKVFHTVTHKDRTTVRVPLTSGMRVRLAAGSPVRVRATIVRVNPNGTKTHARQTITLRRRHRRAH